MPEIRLASMNIGKGATKFLPVGYDEEDVAENLRLIADLITSNDIDAVGLQEVDVRTNRSRRLDEPTRLRRDLRWGPRAAHFAPAIDFNGGEFGNAVLLNMPHPALSYKDSRAQQLRFPKNAGREDRSAAAVRIDLKLPEGQSREFKNLWFVSTHFDIPFVDWIQQLCKLLAHSVDYAFPVLVCGDLNILEKSEGQATAEYNLMSETFAKYRYRDLGPLDRELFTFPRNAKKKLDYMFVRDDRRWFNFSPPERIRMRLGKKWLSDHWGIVSTMEY